MQYYAQKVRFQHEVYSQMTPEAGIQTEHPVSRQVFSVQDLEIRDRLASSMMNKFLYLYSSKEMPRKAHSNMVRSKMHLQTDCMVFKVSLKPRTSQIAPSVRNL